MRRLLLAAAVLGMVLPACLAGASGPPKPSDAPDWRAACLLLKIELDPAVVEASGPMMQNIIEALAIQLRGETPPGEARHDIEFSLQEYRRGGYMVRLYVAVPRSSEVAAEFVKRLRVVLRSIDEDYVKQVRSEADSVERRHRDAREQFERVMHERDRIAHEAGLSDLSREAVLQRIKELEGRKQQLEMELVGTRARLKATEQRIAELGFVAADKVKADTVATELEKILMLREQQYRGALEAVEKGAISRQEMLEAELRVVEAKVQLATRREAVAQAAGGEALGKLNAELAGLAVAVADLEARLKYVAGELEKIAQRGQLAAADGYETRLAPMLKAARARFESDRRRLDEINMRLGRMRPHSLTVLDGSAAAAEGQADTTRPSPATGPAPGR